MANKVNVKDFMAEFMFAESVHRFNEARRREIGRASCRERV